MVQILFDTARDLGEPGNDFVYGHGALDLGAALAAAGAGNIPTAGGDGGGGGGGSSGGGLAVAGLALAGAGIYALMNGNEEELQRTVMVDSYGRAFQFGFADRITIRDQRPSIFSMFANQQADFNTVSLARTENSYTQAYVTKSTINPYSYTAGDKIEDSHISFLNRAELPDGYYAMTCRSLSVPLARSRPWIRDQYAPKSSPRPQSAAEPSRRRS